MITKFWYTNRIKSKIKTKFIGLAIAVVSVSGVIGYNVLASSNAGFSATTWWPLHNAKITGTQPFKGVVHDLDTDQYEMYWRVDGGSLNKMYTSYNEAPHKEVMVDVSGWKWKGQGPYTVTYVAKDLAGNEIAQTSYDILNTDASQSLQSAKPATTSVTAKSAPVTVKIPTQVNENTAPDKPFAGIGLYVDPISNAKNQANTWRTQRPADALQMDKLAAQPQAKWVGGWNPDVTAEVSQFIGAASKQSKIGTLVAYNIPQRDCGGYSAGGSTAADYMTWVNKIVKGIGTNKAIVVLEPDALSNMDCLSAPDQATRASLISQAVAAFKTNPNSYVYIDAGHPRWHSATVMATRLSSANIKQADGFSLNISNFIATSENASYGKTLSDKLAGKHFVIDTSRNGNGPTADSQWCNPDGRALGNAPTTQVGNSIVDAYLWIKAPGESDGECNDGPVAGVWWPEYALGLVNRSSL